MLNHVPPLLFKTVLAVFCLSANRLPAGEMGPSSDWITDDNAGVRIWNPFPAAGESVQWLGAKESATGLGVAIWKAAGKESERVSGEWNEGRVDGLAVWKHRNGNRYEGQWRNGHRHGTGIYSWPDGTRFCGAYAEGARQEGAFFSSNGVPVNGIPPDNVRTIVLEAEAAALQARKIASKARRLATRRPSPETTQSTPPATVQSEP